MAATDSRTRSAVDLTAPSSFRVRFIRKLSDNIRTKFARKESRGATGGGPYQRQTRSMSVDVRQKPYMSQPQFMTMPRSSGGTDGMEDSPISGTSSASPSTMRQPSSDVEREQRPRSDDIRETRRSLFQSASSSPAGETRSPPMSSPSRASGSSLPPASFPVADTRPEPQSSQSPTSLASTSMATATATENLQVPISPGGGSGRRSPAPRLATLPPPPARFTIEGGLARLSPSVITRHPPFPILNLPSISTTTPGPSQPRRIRPQSRLSSMPALPREGPDDSHHQADHENAMLAESDEEEEMEGDGEGEEEMREGDMGSDDEEGDDTTESRRSESSYRDPEGLPQVSSSPFDASFLQAKKDGPKGELTPTARRALDYFSSKPVLPEPTMSPLRTPKAGDSTRQQPLAVPMPTPGSPRPGLYQQASRSMVDLLSPKQTRVLGGLQDDARPKAPEPGPSAAGASEGIWSPRPPPPPKEPEDLGPSLRRRRSMPMFNPNTEPPPYPSFFPQRHKAPAVQPREEEGREQLPPYSNSIYLAAIMPRKMEFTAPGVQAKDRKWRRVYCVLEGTAFRVYKCPPGVAGVNPVTEWWENKVGVGDATNTSGTTYDGRIRIDAVRTNQRAERPPKLSEDAQSESSRSGGDQQSQQQEQRQKEQSKSKRFTVSLLHPSRLANSNSNSGPSSRFGRSSLDSSRGGDASSSGRPSLTLARPPSHSSSAASSLGGSSNNGGLVASPTSLSPSSAGGSRSHFRSSRLPARNSASAGANDHKPQELPPPDPKDLLRVYTLQHAESGLGSDYMKRRNVIRVRVEGEQFLLQAADVASVVDWIEGFQAATNIALDLDERPMPKGPMFPRRRRRRVRRPEEAAQANASDTPSRPPS